MKIVMVCEFYNEDLDYQEILLAKYYKKLGHNVVVITTPTTSVHQYIDGEDEDGFKSVETGRFSKIFRVPIKFNFLGRIRVFESIRSIVESESPDLLYFHDIIPNMIELRAYLQKNMSCCAIMDYHADYSNSGANALSRIVLHRIWRRAMLATVRKRLSAILPVVPASQWFLRDLYGIQPDETELFPLGVDVDLANEVRGSSARQTIRQALSIPDDALVIFTGGKLVPLKRTEEVLAAVAAIADPRLHVIVVGEARDADYRKLLSEAASDGKVHFVGWQDREGVYRHQAAADLAVFPASQSVLWQQSIGMGLPLVVGEGDGPPRMRQDVSYMNLAGNIHVLDPEAGTPANQIAAFLRDCLDDREILARMAIGAEQVTRSFLSYERLAQRTLEIVAQHRAASGESKRDHA